MAQTDGSLHIDTGLDSTGFERGSEKMQQAVESLERSAIRSGENIQRAVNSTFDGVNATPLTDEVRRAEIAAAKAELKLQEAQQALMDFAQTEIPTDGYRNISDAISRTEAALLRLYDRRDMMADMGVDQSSAQWRRLALQIGNTEAKLEGFEADAAAMRAAGTAFIKPEETQQFQKLSLAAQQASLELDQAYAKVQSAQGAMQNNASSMDEMGSRVRDRVGGAFAAAAESVKSAAAQVAKFAANLAKAGAQKVVSGIKAVVSGIKNIGRHSSGSALTANKLAKALSSMKRIFVTQIKRTFMSYLFSETQTAMQELAKFDSAYNKSVSNMRNRTTELSANITSSLGSLIKAVEPYITAAINAVSNAVVKISAMLAALRGEKTVTVAKQQTASYADSLSNTAKSADAAAAAQRKLNASISGYDQLHKLTDNSSTGSGNSLGGSTGADLFETVAVDNVLPDVGQQMVERIKESIASGDWYGTGTAVAAGLNQIISTIDSKILEITPKAVQWATNIAQGLNGLTGNMDGYAIGKTLADGIDLAFGTLDAFIATYNWSALRDNIGQSINGLLMEIDWERIGQTFGDSLGAVFSVLYGVITNIQWRESGQRVGQGFNTLISTVTWKQIGETFGEALKGIFGFIASTIEEIDWVGLAHDLSETIKGVDWTGVAETLAESLGAIVGAAVALLGTMLYDILIEPLQGYFEEEFEKWDTGSLGLNIVLGICSGIVDGLADIGTWIGEHIFYPFIEGFKKAFGIHSPSTVMAEQGGYIVTGLLNGIKENWTAVPDWLIEQAEDLVKGVKKKWDDLKTATSQKFTAIKDEAALKWDNIKSKITEKAELIRSELSGKWSEVKSNASSKFTELKTTLELKLDDTKTALGKISFKSIGENIVSGLKNGVTSTWHTASGKLTELAGGLVDDVKGILGIHSPSKVFAQIGGFITAGLNNGLTDGESTVMRTVGGMASSLIDAMDVDAPDIGVNGRMLSGLSQAAAHFEKIAQAFAAIDHAIASMGGMMIPQMATGSIVPAKVAVANSPRVGDRTTEDNELLSLLRKIIALLDGSRPSNSTKVPIDVVSKIGRRELARAIAEIDISDGRVTNGGGRR